MTQMTQMVPETTGVDITRGQSLRILTPQGLLTASQLQLLIRAIGDIRG
jgi:hypothetical protein